MENLHEKYEEMALKTMEDFISLKPDDEGYAIVGKMATEMYKFCLEEEKLMDERINREYERGLESEKQIVEEKKLEHETELERRKRIGEYILKGVDVFCVVMKLAVNSSDQNRIMMFEKEGVIRTRAFDRTQKINTKL